MNVLLLGNGFDLYYHLPTKYQNFLHTVDYLIQHYSEEIKSVGDVFSAAELQEKDAFISECYNIHKDIYDNTALNQNDILELIEHTKDNMWFQYLLKSFDKDVGWIDFEREISTVISVFKEFLDNLGTIFGAESLDKSRITRYIVRCFNFFYEVSDPMVSAYGRIPSAQFSIIPEFKTEYPFGSKIEVPDTEKIIKHLSLALESLTKALKMYLGCFVENILGSTNITDYLEKQEVFLHNDYVVTLNYTNTFETIYSANDVFHLHGNVQDDIVLGINSDACDELENTDTSFITFKKYYHRIMLETDKRYLQWITDEICDGRIDIHLLVMGHSLDVTDADIITDLFGLASEITILYHSNEAKASHIANLVKIFGKSGLDKLREEQQLTFLPLDMDLTEFAERRTRNRYIFI